MGNTITRQSGSKQEGKGPVVILLGTFGQAPFAGMVWQALHYLEGFKRLGCDVYYVEDTGAWPFNRDLNEVSADCSFTVRYIAEHLKWIGLEHRWAYRAASENDR